MTPPGAPAYLAGFHAAQALIFETHRRAFKSHSGVRSEFARLVKDDARVDHELRGFLGYAYQLKEIADYESDPGSKVSASAARAALETARRFVECVTGLIPKNDSAPQAPGG